MNDLGQPVGLPVEIALPRPAPRHVRLEGQHGAVVPLEAGHAEALFEAFAEDPEGRGWTYMPQHPWPDVATARAWAMQAAASEDPLFFAVTDLDGVALGVCSFLRIAPEAGSVEVGFIHFAPALQRTRLATEAMALMMGHVFDDLGYRRYEWKCDALNAPSRAAAERLGFTYEGTFRQATVVKGRNRDTAWFSVVDHEWPRLKGGFEAWFAPENFDAEGRQRTSLRALREG